MKENSAKLKYIIKGSLIIIVFLLVSFICFCKMGILFSKTNEVITVSTKSKKFDPKRYAASVLQINKIDLIKKEELTTASFSWNGDVLSKSKGVVIGPSGKETYYNLNMSIIVSAMRNMGYTEEEYPYWIREDGVKMLGQYVMVAANYSIRPKGTIIQSSLGYAIVCDTGGFVSSNPTQIDIAVNW